MNTLSSHSLVSELHRSLRPLARLVFGLFVFLSAGIVSAMDVSGVYSDKGTAVSTDPKIAPVEVSLHALLTLDFVSPAGAYATTDRVHLREFGNLFDARALDEEENVLWKGQWQYGQGYTEKDKKMTIWLRKSESDSEGYAFEFELVGESGMLQLTANRVTATAFGPVIQPVGTYFFGRDS